ncbi:hypothetical protein BLNAU_9408 [Blattamonas nauphoetae]|uniref:Uncharacterized protein n=1 Tax=Blattamonas nauphoetae TaxID=2049346 RepID=A0ABQ9XVP7_9EUKA|nr:hypothetical protein BLNAU_9408 [Blattamonas nauphoetae]
MSDGTEKSENVENELPLSLSERYGIPVKQKRQRSSKEPSEKTKSKKKKKIDKKPSSNLDDVSDKPSVVTSSPNHQDDEEIPFQFHTSVKKDFDPLNGIDLRNKAIQQPYRYRQKLTKKKR